jgi:hypothetical protein
MVTLHTVTPFFPTILSYMLLHSFPTIWPIYMLLHLFPKKWSLYILLHHFSQLFFLTCCYTLSDKMVTFHVVTPFLLTILSYMLLHSFPTIWPIYMLLHLIPPFRPKYMLIHLPFLFLLAILHAASPIFHIYVVFPC